MGRTRRAQTRIRRRTWLAATSVVGLLVGSAAVAPQEPAPAVTLAPGQVVALAGTAMLWVVDDQGVAHFASDPGALAGRVVDWQRRTDVTLPQLRTLPRGEPWLTAAFVRIREDVFLPQWPAGAGPPAPPTLLRIRSLDDLALLGVNGTNYTDLVIEAPAWEQRYDALLARATLDGDLVFPEPMPTPTPTPDVEFPL